MDAREQEQGHIKLYQSLGKTRPVKLKLVEFKEP